ncbi:hypothetical protein ACGFIB_07850 [Microbispora bryophytorum]|uniref:hypothetical protein n=1 Tax=Microbispora bryophytorum TaxID=1460882 RepID=UPI00371A47AC
MSLQRAAEYIAIAIGRTMPQKVEVWGTHRLVRMSAPNTTTATGTGQTRRTARGIVLSRETTTLSHIGPPK